MTVFGSTLFIANTFVYITRGCNAGCHRLLSTAGHRHFPEPHPCFPPSQSVVSLPLFSARACPIIPLFSVLHGSGVNALLTWAKEGCT